MNFDLNVQSLGAAVLIGGTLLASAAVALSQESASPSLSVQGSTVRFRIPGFSSSHYGSAGPDVVLHDFTVNGKAISGDSLHGRQLKNGVFEVTADARLYF